jgi:hypothetical protein
LISGYRSVPLYNTAQNHDPQTSLAVPGCDRLLRMFLEFGATAPEIWL